MVLESRGGVAVVVAGAAAEEPEPPGGRGGLAAIFAVPVGETEKGNCENVKSPPLPKAVNVRGLTGRDYAR